MQTQAKIDKQTQASLDMPQAGLGVSIAPITDDDGLRVGKFLHSNLNSRIGALQWARAFSPRWQVNAPNHGFMLVAGGQIVGVQLALYSDRQTENGVERICNVAAFCVLQDYRVHSVRLLKALLSQRNYIFTDLSPSGNVRPLNTRLGFRALDTATALVFNLPRPHWPDGTRIVTSPIAIANLLTGRDLQIYRDHLDAEAAHHLVLVQQNQICYVIFRKDRRKNLPLFATVLHVGNPELFAKIGHHFFANLLIKHAIPMALVEHRVAKSRPMPSIMLASNRVKMYRGDPIDPAAIDYLYSELTCVAW